MITAKYAKYAKWENFLPLSRNRGPSRLAGTLTHQSTRDRLVTSAATAGARPKPAPRLHVHYR